jgi:hypothetical protein
MRRTNTRRCSAPPVVSTAVDSSRRAAADGGTYRHRYAGPGGTSTDTIDYMGYEFTAARGTRAAAAFALARSVSSSWMTEV